MAEGNRLRVLSPKNDKRLLADIWVKQSDLMWRTVYTTPAIATAIFVGWYVIWRDGALTGKLFLADAILGVGTFIMIIQGLIIHRMARYLNVLRGALGDALPHVAPSGLFRGKLRLPLGYELAIAVPSALGLLFAAMFVMSIMKL
jgi:hypothetical protein